MKICHVIYQLPSGGAEKLILDLAKNLADRGQDVSVVVLSDENDIYSSQLNKLGVPVVKMGFKRRFDFLAFKRLAKELRHYDVVHVHLFPALYIVAFLKLIFGMRPILVYTEHNTHNRRRAVWWLRVPERIAYSAYRVVVAISKPVRQALEAWVPQVGRNITIINNGVDIKLYRDASPAQDICDLRNTLDASPVFVLMVGALGARKDQDTLIKAVAKLPQRFHLLLVGDGVRKAVLHDLASALSCLDRVHFFGFRSDVPAIMKACDVYVQSSNWEGFGLVVVEAMAAGLPVVASDVAGMSSVVEGAGLLFPPGEVDALAERILETEGALVTLSQKGTARAPEFDISHYVEKHISLYSSLLKVEV